MTDGEATLAPQDAHRELLDGDLLNRVDSYLHAVPLSAATPHDVGPFTVFRSTTAWPYYARPRPDRAADIAPADIEPDDIEPDDIERLGHRCAELGVPLSLEWLVETAPSLSAAAAAAGLNVVEYPLLVLDRAAFVPAGPPEGVDVTVLPPDGPLLVRARAVADVAFGAPGTGCGPAGTAARDAEVPKVGADQAAALVARGRAGVTVTAAAIDQVVGMLASGAHQRVGDTTEIVAVATLPAVRRRGLGAAVTSELVAHAFGHGVDLVLLSAQTVEVARVYERLGFRRIGHAGAAEPADH